MERKGALVGQVALITGGARNIGRQVALTFAGAGADVAITSRTPEQVNETVTLLREQGRRAFGVACDASSASRTWRLTSAFRRALVSTMC